MNEKTSSHGLMLEFTTDWFASEAIWVRLMTRYQPRRFLEIGSYEGRTACFVIGHRAKQRPIELRCIDTWGGSLEHDLDCMSGVEARFDKNISQSINSAPFDVDFLKYKMSSRLGLAALLAEGLRGYFDFIYVDGSHQAPDVLFDAVVAFELLKRGGILIFDDYLWTNEGAGHQDVINMPKLAVDSFVNIYQRKIRVLREPLYQLYLQKTST